MDHESIPLELRPVDGGRTDSRGYAVRSNADWRDTATRAIRERDAAKAEARDATEALHAANAKLQALESELAESMDATARWMEAAKRDATWLAAFVGELGGITLSQLPKGAYGAALASLFCDYAAGRDAPG